MYCVIAFLGSRAKHGVARTAASRKAGARRQKLRIFSPVLVGWSIGNPISPLSVARMTYPILGMWKAFLPPYPPGMKAEIMSLTIPAARRLGSAAGPDMVRRTEVYGRSRETLVR